MGARTAIITRHRVWSAICRQFTWRPTNEKPLGETPRGSFTPVARWREREGIEPTAPTEGPGPTDLKSAKPTRTHPLPGHDSHDGLVQWSLFWSLDRCHVKLASDGLGTFDHRKTETPPLEYDGVLHASRQLPDCLRVLAQTGTSAAAGLLVNQAIAASRRFFSTVFGTAPTTWSTGLPPLKIKRVGMPLIP